MKKYFMLIPLLTIGGITSANSSFPDFPMTIYGDIKIGNTDLIGGIMKIYDGTNAEIASFDITNPGKYGSNNAAEEHLLLNRFEGNLSFKVIKDGKNYIVDSIDDTKKGERCPSKDAIRFISTNCRYDIYLKEENSSNKSIDTKSIGGSNGGGGGGSESLEKTKDSNSTTGTINTGDVQYKTGENKIINGDIEDESKEEDNKESSNKTRYEEGNQSEVLSNGYTREFNNAYRFAYMNGITTMDDISKADMNGPLTRIAMSKMLSQYAINVLGKVPANIVVPNFSDVTSELNEQYGEGVTLAYQLGIMGIGIEKFRPFDLVTRAEFGTALSRMLYRLTDGTDIYYTTHLSKLKNEGIINNDNPTLEELRGYVMLMLMRSASNKIL